ncbi:hypothetical protein QUB80_34810 [Chlorogloeopsis sp. ULAP01]|uniref:hypothetical protein n=1 Tax=Chlorogloeopsis sp. ULAP01 TaxID=3056483 RepID=UPI0025AACF90|nr:hypothetical protein [Chlorogloeopsis sp. ULAP01]MDM9385825.1 hypothetical protein [Chlorogloeopsis sp. ULAP01]
MLSNMNLSPKAIRFIVEALEFRIAAYHQQLELEEMNEDEISDIGNDLMFLDALVE